MSADISGSRTREGSVGDLASLAVMLAVVTVPAFLYLHVRSARAIHITGSDAFGYEWQIRAVGLAPLHDLGGRPGVAGLGSMLQGLHVLPGLVAPPVLGLAVAVALGLAVGTVVRLSLRLPMWQSGVVAAGVAMWTGTAKMGVGYLGNLISLAAFVVALSLTLLPGKRGRVPWTVFLCFLAAGLLHPVFLLLYLGLCALWAAASFVLSAVRHDADLSASSKDALWLLAAAVASCVVVAFILFVPLRLSTSDILDLQVQQLGERLAHAVGRVFTPVAIFTIALGLVVAWRRTRGSWNPLILFGSGWLAVGAIGVLLGAVRPSFPGFRVLIVTLPIPVLSALGIAGTIGWAGKPARLLMKVLASGLAVAVAVLAFYWMARPTVRLYLAPPAAAAAQEVATYVQAVPPNTPVVVVMQPPGLPGILLWKTRLNQIRASAPREKITQIVAYMGRPDQALAGHQTLVTDQSDPVSVAFNRASDRLWRAFGSQVADPNSIVIVPRSFVSPGAWQSVARYVVPGGAPDIAVLRGPPTTELPAQLAPSIPSVKAWAYCIACALALGLAGGGYAVSALRTRGGRALDSVALAPAMGIVALTLTGLVVAAVGADPHGPAGIASAGVVAVAGYVHAFAPRDLIRLRRREG